MSIMRCAECEKEVDTDFTDECWCEDGIIKDEAIDSKKVLTEVFNGFAKTFGN